MARVAWLAGTAVCLLLGSSARQPGDYTSTTATLTFAPGQTARTVTVPVARDTVDENDETLGLVLSHPVRATIADDRATGTILDDDAAPAISIDDATQPEGDAGTRDAPFTVALSAASERTITVELATADGSATAGRDYVPAHGTVTFAPGETARTVGVAVTGDTVPERSETFRLRQVGGAAAGVGTIVDDDPAIGRLRAPRSARLADVFCRRGARCRGVRLRVAYGGAGAGRWRFVVSDAAVATIRAAARARPVVLGVRRVRVTGATTRTVIVRLGRTGRAGRLYRAVRRQRRPVLTATLDFTSTEGRHQRAARQVRLR